MEQLFRSLILAQKGYPNNHKFIFIIILLYLACSVLEECDTIIVHHSGNLRYCCRDISPIHTPPHSCKKNSSVQKVFFTSTLAILYSQEYLTLFHKLLWKCVKTINSHNTFLKQKVCIPPRTHTQNTNYIKIQLK